MAKFIVSKVLSSLGMQRFATLLPVGAARDLFSAGAGLLLGGDTNFANKLLLFDGDVFRTRAERLGQMNVAITGTEATAQSRRDTVLSSFRELIPGGVTIAPEPRLHQMVRTLTNSTHQEIVEIAGSIVAVNDTHSFIGKIIEPLGLSWEVGCSHVVDAAAESPDWAVYTSELSQWLTERRPALLGQ